MKCGAYIRALLVGVLLTLAVTKVWAQTVDGEAQPDFSPITAIAEEQVRAGYIPGAVVLVGHHGRTVYRKAFGYRTQGPGQQFMTEDTVFDLASVTKPVATATAVMQLAEAGQIRLDDPVARYWTGFEVNGKDGITVRQLLTHYSGLRADLDLKPSWSGYDAALRLILAEKPVAPPGTRFIYSDINFAVLGELVRRVSGQPLDAYCAEHIFKPLGMNDTGFTPAPALWPRLAPTGANLPPGEVHDPTARRMGGVAGHAGLFATADDLARFARMLLSGGSLRGARILDPATVEEMELPQSPKVGPRLRGLGWDLAAPFSANRDGFPPVGSFGHTGFTGTMLWIDPVSDSYVIVLTNRVYPDGKGDAGPLRREIVAAVASALGPLPVDRIIAVRPSLARYFTVPANQVATGADVLVAEKFAPLKGKRVGLITNHTGRDHAGNRLIDLLNEAPGVTLAAIFTPEHGLRGDLDDKVASGMDPSLHLPVYSLYGEVRRPTDKMLDGLDALVFDIQDAGARFYTYATTMAYAMEAAARKGIPFYVLDRPNPIDGDLVQGPVLDPELKSFTGYFPLPVRHGMTMGELARLFNSENKVGADLRVIPMRGYRRSAWYDETGLPWVNPSPNLRSLIEVALYPGVGMVEGANVSVGRGTDTPFEILGAPWIDGKALAAYLSRREIPGVSFTPVEFTPSESRFKDQLCHGVRIALTDRNVLNAPALGVELASALSRLYPAEFRLDRTLGSVGARWVLEAIRGGEDPRAIGGQWSASLDRFRRLRAGYLLY